MNLESGYKKGPLGQMLEARKLMARLSVASMEWCRAFDAGDNEALEHINHLCAEIAIELNDVFKRVSGQCH